MSVTAFEQQFQTFVSFCTEDYLIRYTNKGLYNRALKDIDKGASVQYTWAESSVTCELGDGTVCTLEVTLETASCTCPADNICKHILTAILFYAQMSPAEPTQDKEQQVISKVDAVHEQSADYTGTSGTSESVERSLGALASSDRFQWLLDLELMPLLKPFSASIIEEVMFRLRYPEQLEVMEESLLTVQLLQQGVEVSFQPYSDPAKALCKVKQRAGEMYKLEALLRYRQLNGLDDRESLSSKVHRVAFSVDTVRECQSLLGAMLRTGLASLPQSYTAQLETLAVAAHSGNLPDVERGLRGIQGELELFFSRHMRFSMEAMLDRITKLYLVLELLSQQLLPSAQQSQLVGTFRSKYYTLPRLRLYGLGADPWQTRSGFRGITYYMYSPDDQEIYTYSSVRAVYYDNIEFSYALSYSEFTPWLANLTMQQFAASQLAFESVKVNAERRISSGEGARLTLEPRIRIEERDVTSLLADASELVTRVTHQRTMFDEAKEHLAIIRLERIVERRYEKGSQSLVFVAEGKAGEQLELILPYQADWDSSIKRLEAGYGTSALEDFYAFVRVEEKQITPISFLKDQKVLSLKLDL